MGSALVKGAHSNVVNNAPQKLVTDSDTQGCGINGAAASQSDSSNSSSNTKKLTGRVRSVVVIQVVPSVMEEQLSPVGKSQSITSRLKRVLEQLDSGIMPNPDSLREELQLAVLALSQLECADQSEDDILSSVSNTQVRAWLATTFTRTEGPPLRPRTPLTGKERFKAVANTIIIGKYFENIIREPVAYSEPQFPPAVTKLLEESRDQWGFPIFEFEKLSPGNILRYTGFELFKCYNLFEKCSISPSMFNSFMTRIESDYGCHGNPYHNATHGADVALTMHYFIQQPMLKCQLSHLDILSLLLSALIHDVHHPGTSNAFQIALMSDYALMYNDKSVLENHHIHHTFKLLREKQFDILSGLSPEDYKQVRGLVIDMVLATDMSTHFQQVKNMKQMLSCPTSCSQLLTTERSKTFSLLLHVADISHPGKKWEEHLKWSELLCEEFFKQGDRERELDLTISPLCDRENTNLPESQLGFIEYIVTPSFEVCGSLFESLASTNTSTNENSDDKSHDWIWCSNITKNKSMWHSRRVPNNQSNSPTHGSNPQEPEIKLAKVPPPTSNGSIKNKEMSEVTPQTVQVAV